jgi:Rod binding domain-containing protein
MDLSPISAAGMASSTMAAAAGVHANQTPAQQRTAVAGQFEAIMLRQLLGDSMGALMGGDNSAAGGIYGYMLTDVFASKLAAGGGMGLSKVISSQLAPRAEIEPTLEQKDTL